MQRLQQPPSPTQRLHQPPSPAQFQVEAAAAMEIFEHTSTVLSDPDTFKTVVSLVFNLMSGSKGVVKLGDLSSYFATIASEVDEDIPTKSQVSQVFKAMDLDGDQAVTKDELQVFLRHLLTQHQQHSEEKLAKAKQQDLGKSKQAAIKEARERLKATRSTTMATNLSSALSSALTMNEQDSTDE